MAVAQAEIFEWRGITDLVAAEVLIDNAEEYSTGTPFSVAGVAEISKATESSSEAHYYNNHAAVVIQGEGADTLTISASGLALETEPKLLGQYYSATKGALVEGERQVKYYAIGYKTQKTNGDEVYVWRHKGTFAALDKTNATQNNGTDANGQQLVYTGIQTSHKFTATGKGAKALIVDDGLGLADVSTFFDAVTTIDTLAAKE